MPIPHFSQLMIPWVACGLLAVGLTWVALRRRDLTYVGLLALAGIGLANNQVVTGLQIENFHWGWVWGPMISYLTVILAAAPCAARSLGSRRAVGVLAALLGRSPGRRGLAARGGGDEDQGAGRADGRVRPVPGRPPRRGGRAAGPELGDRRRPAVRPLRHDPGRPEAADRLRRPAQPVRRQRLVERADRAERLPARPGPVGVRGRPAPRPGRRRAGAPGRATRSALDALLARAGWRPSARSRPTAGPRSTVTPSATSPCPRAETCPPRSGRDGRRVRAGTTWDCSRAQGGRPERPRAGPCRLGRDPGSGSAHVDAGAVVARASPTAGPGGS